MKNRWILFIYPILGLGFLLLGYGLFKDWIALSLKGEREDAVVAALFLNKGDGTAELLSRLEHRIYLFREDGSTLEVMAEDFEIQSITDDGEALDLSNGVAAALRDDQSLANDLDELIKDAADRTQWFMLRQSRLTEPTRFVRMEKNEVAHIYQGLPALLTTFEQAEDGQVVPAGDAANAEIAEVHTKAVYSYEDPEALLERKGDHLISYERLIDGEPVDELDSQFFIHNEPYATISYPVFTFDYQGQAYAVLSDLGKHGDPFLAFPYQADAVSVFLPEDPTMAMLVGKIVPPEPGEKYLNWFSKVSEITMTRWVYPGMVSLVAFVCFLVGGIFISMIVFPVKKLPPVPEEKKAEKGDGDRS